VRSRSRRWPRSRHFFVGTVWYAAINYYRVHKRAHLDPAWARTNLPWHYDHHMGPEQDANWCVTRPWFDDLLGTRRPYLGTDKATRDEARRQAKVARGAAAVAT
jgi:sterol desaturase/sphingolipid hydroxylase (fatty acid hydroxylase superfamily)